MDLFVSRIVWVVDLILYYCPLQVDIYSSNRLGTLTVSLIVWVVEIIEAIESSGYTDW